jgi:ribosomal protein L37AE/L43A
MPFDNEIDEKLKIEKFNNSNHECCKCSLEGKEKEEKCPANVWECDINCEYNIFKDNQSTWEDYVFEETGYFFFI